MCAGYVTCEESAVCFLTCVFWILKSTEDLLATSSLGMLCSMASEGESRDTMSHSSRQHQLLTCVVNKYLMVGSTHISV